MSTARRIDNVPRWLSLVDTNPAKSVALVRQRSRVQKPNTEAENPARGSRSNKNKQLST